MVVRPAAPSEPFFAHAWKTKFADIPASVAVLMFLSVSVSPSDTVITTFAPDCAAAPISALKLYEGSDTVSAFVRLVIVADP